MEYFQDEKKAKRKKIINLYEAFKDDIDKSTWLTPLREFTYEEKAVLTKRDGSLFSPNENLAFLVDQYLHLYGIREAKDVNLWDALYGIRFEHLFPLRMK